MRDYEQIFADARDEMPFSNSDHGYGWMANWCERCTNDSQELVDKGEGCPLILVALMGKTPIEWLEQENGDFHCIEFRDGRSGPSEPPPPPPQCPGQGELFDPAPYEGVRMFSDVVDEIRPIGVSH